MQERWKPVVGYEGFYEVSDHGRVRSLDRVATNGQFYPGRMLACSVDHSGEGYRYTRLSVAGVGKKANVHVLVLEAFVGPRPSVRHEACHGDGDRSNAALANLRWDTPEANWADRLEHGTDTRGERGTRARLTSELVQWIRESPQSSKDVAAALNVASSTVRAARLGVNWGHLRTATDPGEPARFQRAARRALERLNATPIPGE